MHFWMRWDLCELWAGCMYRTSGTCWNCSLLFIVFSFVLFLLAFNCFNVIKKRTLSLILLFSRCLFYSISLSLHRGRQKSSSFLMQRVCEEERRYICFSWTWNYEKRLLVFGHMSMISDRNIDKNTDKPNRMRFGTCSLPSRSRLMPPKLI